MNGTRQSKTKTLLFGTQTPSALGAGVALALVVMFIATLTTRALNKALPFEKDVLSPILVAIILGLIARNMLPLSGVFDPGIKFGLKKLLRLGIMLMGIRLSIFAVMEIGSVTVGMVAICIIAALVITGLAAKRIGIGPRLGTLVAAGTSICGVSAIVATAPAIDAEEEETAYAVATITIFGILATILYPYLVELVLHLRVAQAGFLLGTSVHDTSQVTASSIIYDQLWAHRTPEGITGADVAITTKLVRNTFMVLVIPFLGFWFARKGVKGRQAQRPSLASCVPLFVFGFIIMGVVRSLGDYCFGADDTSWKNFASLVKESATYIIAVAVTCIGLNTNVRKLLGLGYKPFLCGLIAAVSVGAVSLLLVTLFGGYLRF